MNRIAKELLKIARELIADSDYIYDPDHKKKPAGGYHKTEKGWSKLEQKKDKSVKTEKVVNVKDYLNSPKGKHYLKHLELLKELKEEGMFQGKKYQTALNPNTSSKTLDKMSKDSSFKIRLFVSCNPNTSTETLDRLSENKEDEIRSHVARHPNTSMETLKKLSKDKQDYIVEYAKENLSKRNG